MVFHGQARFILFFEDVPALLKQTRPMHYPMTLSHRLMLLRTTSSFHSFTLIRQRFHIYDNFITKIILDNFIKAARAQTQSTSVMTSPQQQLGNLICDNIKQFGMNSTSEIEEVYFEENQPQVQSSAVQQQQDEDKFGYSSCLIKRDSAQTAPLERHRQHRPNFFDKDMISSPKKLQTRTVLKRKQTYDQSTSPVRNCIDFKSTNKNSTAGSYRTIYSSKKQSYPMESISPENYIKIERKSQSPNRKNLYWQAWLLQPKQPKFTSNHSGLISKTLKYERQPLPHITASSYIAMMADDHEILVQNNQNQKREIASLTKIMTAYTVICICNTYGIKIREHKITILQQASFMQGTSANLRMDEEITIIDLLYGLLLPSGNDAGVALAQYFGKFLSFKFAKDSQTNERYEFSMEKFQSYKNFYDSNYQKESIRLFVFEMNKNSHKIGLENTHFANPTGLSNNKNYSTAKDMAILTTHCLKNHLMREIFKKKVYNCIVTNQKLSYTRQVQWRNTNKHLYQFRQCIGAKTGITPTAGPCLSSVYRVMNREIVVIVLNCASIDERYQDARSIYKWCRTNMKIR